MRGDHARRAKPGARPEGRRDDRDTRHVRAHELEARHVRHVGEAHVLQRPDAPAAAGPVHEPHERQAQVVRGALGPDHLLMDRGVGRAPAHREVVGLDDRAPAGDAALADDHVGRQERAQLPVAVVVRATRQRAGLVERALLEEPVDALADRQPPARVLALHPLGPAHLVRELGAPAQLVELGAPVGGRMLWHSPSSLPERQTRQPTAERLA